MRLSRRLLLLLLPVACCLLPAPLRGAIAPDDARSSTAIGSNTITISNHVTSSGADRAMFIGVQCYSNNPSVSGVTVDGAAAINLWDNSLTSGFWRSSGWYFLNATAGTNTIVATFAATCDYSQMSVISMTGVHQSTPTRAVPTPIGSAGTSPSITVSGVQATDYLLDLLWADGNTGADFTVGANQTLRTQNNNIQATGSGARTSSQSGADGGVMSWTLANSRDYIIGAVAFIEASAGGAQLCTRALTGVGC